MISMLKKFISYNFYTDIEVSNMIRHSSKSNNLKTMSNRLEVEEKRHHPKTENLLCKNKSHCAYNKF